MADEGKHGACVPKEETGVPQEFATRHKLTGEIERRLFGEGFERKALVAEFFTLLNVAVGRVGCVSRHAHGEEGVVGADKFESGGDFSGEEVFAGDELVGGGGDDTGFGVEAGDVPSGPGSGRCGGELGGLGQDVLRWQLRKLFANGVNVGGEGGDKDVFDGKEGRETLEGEL